MYYQDLEVWKKSIELVKAIYLLSENFPKTEQFGLTNQIRRASVSVPSNIAEGISRYSDKDKSKFLDISMGSVAEVETQLIIAKELGFTDSIDDYIELCKQVSALILGFKKYLNKHND